MHKNVFLLLYSFYPSSLQAIYPGIFEYRQTLEAEWLVYNVNGAIIVPCGTPVLLIQPVLHSPY